MKPKISSILIVFLFTASIAGASFTPLSPDAFKSPVRKFFEKVWECKWHVSCYNKLGAFTQLNSTDRQVNFPTTYNNNLNITMETGTTTVGSITSLPNLATVGTLTTGVWNATTIGIGYGGTGTTTGIQRYGVVLGDGSNGLTVASSTGTLGQFLTSQGGGTYPIWQSASVNETSSYNFTGTYFGVKNLNASSTVANPIILNGVSYSFPANISATNTALVVGTGGQVSWGAPKAKVLNNPNPITLTNATGTIFSTTVPASYLTNGDIINITVQATSTGANNTNIFNLGLSLTGNSTSTCGFAYDQHGATSTLNFTLRITSATTVTIDCNAVGFSSATEQNFTQWNKPGSDLTATPSRDYSFASDTVTLSNPYTLVFEGIVSDSNVSTRVKNIITQYLAQ